MANTVKLDENGNPLPDSQQDVPGDGANPPLWGEGQTGVTGPTPVNANGTGSDVTAGDISGAQGRFQSEYGYNDANGSGIKAYQAARAAGQGHEDAYQAAVTSLGLGKPAASQSGGGGGGGAAIAPGPSQQTPTSTPDNSAMNSLIQQMLTDQQGRDSQSAQEYADQQKFRGNILDTVNGIIQNNSGTASASDPAISSAVSAFKGEGEQAMRQAQESAAARARAEGASTGALDSSIAGGYDTLGQNTGAYSAGLVNTENNNRRAALLGAANTGAGVLGTDESTALQDKIGTLNAALSASQMQGNQAVDWATLLQKPLLASIGAGPGNASAAAQMLGVNNQNQQFYDQFGYNQAKDDNMSSLLGQLLLQGA